MFTMLRDPREITDISLGYIIYYSSLSSNCGDTIDWVIFVVKKYLYGQLVSKFKYTNIIPLQNIFRMKFIGISF